MFHKILVCLDGSKLAEQTLPYAAEQAARFGSSLVLFQVVSIASFPIPTGTWRNRWWYRITNWRTQKPPLGNYLNGLALPLREKGLTVQCVTLIGVPTESIVSYAEENRIRLGCYGHSRV